MVSLSRMTTYTTTAQSMYPITNKLVGTGVFADCRNSYILCSRGMTFSISI